MKIAYLANVRFPSERAHTTQITYMCQAFSSVGIEVHLFVNKRSDDDASDIALYYNIEPLFIVNRISHGYYSYKSKLAFYCSELFFAVNFLLNIGDKKFDIVYSRHEWVVWFLSLFVTPTKLVWESHEAKLNFPAKKLLKKGIKTVVISEGIFEDYIAFGIPNEQLCVAYDGIDESFFGVIESKFLARERLGLPQDKNIAMYIGGFDAWKGIETFFEASALTPDVLFAAIGGNKEQIARFSKMYPGVTFLGPRPYNELKNNQQAADVLVIPNTSENQLSASYTSPLKLFAHLSSGVPIVVSNVRSLISVTGTEKVFVFDADNPSDLADTILRALSNLVIALEHAAELKIESTKYTWTNRAIAIKYFIGQKTTIL